MLSLKKKDFLLRSRFNHLEKRQLLNKVLNTNLSFKIYQNKKDIRRFAISKLNCSHVLISKVKTTRRCILTNRSRSIVRKYNISQSAFQQMSKNGRIFGCQKSCW